MIYQNENFTPITNYFIPGIADYYSISNHGRILNLKNNSFIGSYRTKYHRVKTTMYYANGKLCYDIDNAILEYCIMNNMPYNSSLRILFKDGNPNNLRYDNLFNQADIEAIQDNTVVNNPLISSAPYHVKDIKIMCYDINERWMNISDDIINGILPIYMVSDIGRVYNKQFGSMIYLQVAYNGYVNAYLKLKSGKYVNASVHRLVMKAFSPITNSDAYEVDHIDNNTLNNVLSNLQWLTPQENEAKMHNNYCQIQLSNNDINNICKGFESGMSPMQICYNILHIPYTGNMHARLMDIFRGVKHSDISSSYNF